MATPSSGPAWHVTGQRPDFRQGRTGGFVNGYVVSFELDNGAGSGEVFVPESEYTADKVAAAVRGVAGHMVAIASLAG